MPDTDDDLYDDGAPTDSDSDDELEVQTVFVPKHQTVFVPEQQTVFVDADRKSLGTITARKKLLTKYFLLSKKN